jgi:hypothetical protein
MTAAHFYPNGSQWSKLRKRKVFCLRRSDQEAQKRITQEWYGMAMKLAILIEREINHYIKVRPQYPKTKDELFMPNPYNPSEILIRVVPSPGSSKDTLTKVHPLVSRRRSTKEQECPSIRDSLHKRAFMWVL